MANPRKDSETLRFGWKIHAWSSFCPGVEHYARFLWGFLTHELGTLMGLSSFKWMGYISWHFVWEECGSKPTATSMQHAMVISLWVKMSVFNGKKHE